MHHLKCKCLENEAKTFLYRCIAYKAKCFTLNVVTVNEANYVLVSDNMKQMT